MTTGEFMFLAIGIALGVAGGAALTEFTRARRSARDADGLTLAQDAIPGGGNAAGRRSEVVPIQAAVDPLLGAPPAGGSDTNPSDSTTENTPEPAPPSTPTPVAGHDPTDAADPPPAPIHTGPCAEELRLADERCELATRAQALATAAAEALKGAQRAYDTHTSRSTVAAEVADPRAVRNLKEGAQHAFRAASRASSLPGAAEAAARTWLQEINRINREAAAANHTAQREREAAAAVGATLERLSHEAEAARFGADLADAACLAARTAVANCNERTTAGPGVVRTTNPPPTEPVLSGIDHADALGMALGEGTAPRIFRLLRGDADSMAALVASLAGDDPDEPGRWEVPLTGLLEAIRSDAIEGAFLRFPPRHPFWGRYTELQQRDIARALAALGLRFDGLGGWVDERLPTQRELSLALGYAGLDPMRVRNWPSAEETAALFRDVTVAADEYLAGAAGDMTLAEMVEMLGGRADSLVELWNQWARIRPLLLEEA